MTVFADDEAQIATLERTSASPEAAVPPTLTPSPAPDSTSGDDSAAVTGTGPVGTWGTDDPQQPHLVLGADGTLAGSDGCNALVGTWEQDDDGSIEFKGVASTLMACPGGDQTLGRLDSATVQGDTMTVIDDHDVILATLPRTA
ncbi:META domain-containing protein [Agromyces protaetiae]|uniref:META domain-containing protein n=2 Tax=Agromyces protaetiae TaxID=2509455 RepID=A0A4P6FFT6_9MICO|nr:META domain-containing protein [Agromyces protaetiae]